MSTTTEPLPSPGRPLPPTSRTALFPAADRVTTVDTALPELGPGETLVRVALCGVCATDLHLWQGHIGDPFPLVPGHEFVGEVAAVGPPAAAGSPSRRPPLEVGTHVAVEMLLPCHTCDRCREGRYNLCEEDDPSLPGERGRQYGVNMGASRAPGLWGGYGQYLFVPANAIVHELPAELPWDVAVFTEPLAVAFRAVARARVRPGETVVVVGPGPVGILLAVAARAAGASTVVVTGTRDERLALAAEFGADLTINVRDGDPAALLHERLGRLADVVIEAAGSPVAQQQAVAMVRRGGRVTLTGACGADVPVTFRADEDLLTREIDVLPSFLSAGGYEPSIRLLARREWPIERLLTHRFGLDEVERAFDVVAGRREGAIKAAIDPWATGRAGGHV